MRSPGLRAWFTSAWLMGSMCAACAPASDATGDVQLECHISPSPPRVGPATVDVVLSGASKAPLSAKSMRIEGNMNHAGMVPEIATAREVEPGRYRAEIEFTMGGDWFVIVDAVLTDGRKLQRTVQVPAVAGE